MKKFILLFFVIFSNVSLSFSQELQVKVSGKGPAVLLIPGLASSGEVWDETVENLSQNFECHVVTLPGFGTNPSTDLQAGFISTMENLLEEYIKKQPKQIILIGHSLGGFLSLHLAKNLPDKIEKAVIVDSYPFYSAAFNPAASAENMRPMAEQMKELMLAQSPAQYRAQQEATLPIMTSNSEKLPLAVEWSLQSDRLTTAQAMYELMTNDYREDLAEVNTPLLVLGAWYSGKNYGLTEESVLQNFQNQYQLAQNVQIEMAPTAHHFIMWDNPEWFLEQLNQFLK
ncbi:pimeloyl-ACP methyl ester carboxylesterase [Algoriphagus boseongensis]|uniref:Pimeloyl-ACP methyl ester carboxylesterase n=1 Tax=Algoriphagus boseongensis TaxID=1442587 RepID=A0A4R6T9E1_9BACT|nr:alpha/beta hydrolase [Algoriphagus boseongensis]TDQ18859.1 pimeloyl-ACP methyl ester carboxylesterase [Algoriphagus boseongensis]